MERIVEDLRQLGSVLEMASLEDRTFIKCKVGDTKFRAQEMVVIPIVNQRELSEPRVIAIGDDVRKKVSSWIGHSYNQLHGRVSSDTHECVLQELIEHELNHNEGKRKIPEQMQLVLMGGNAVGILPADLYAASNEEFIVAVRDAAEKQNIDLDAANVRQSRISFGALQINATFPRLVAEPKPGDFVEFGISLTHSSVGNFPSQVSFYAFRLVCTNGQIAPICLGGGQRQRIRRSTTDGAEKTQERIRYMVEQAFREIPDRIRALKKLAVHQVDLRSTIDSLVTSHRWSRHVRDELVDAMDRNEHDGDETAFGVVNLLSFLGTHGSQRPDRPIPQSVRNRLQIVSGVYAGQEFHQCPSCRRIIEPALN